MLKFPARVKGLERHSQILRISSRTMLIHLAGWTINRLGALVVKEQRFLNISLIWIRSKQEGRDPVHTSYENTEGGGLEVGISKNDGES